MKTNGHKTTKAPAFAQRAERALRRAARSVETQSRALSLPVRWQSRGETSMKDVRKYAAEQAIIEEEALAKGTAETSKELVVQGAEVYT
jgi:hypothetical protein